MVHRGARAGGAPPKSATAFVCLVTVTMNVTILRWRTRTKLCLFFQVFGEHKFWGPLIPLFWISGDLCPGFQSQGGSLFACFLACVILRFTSGGTPADCIEVSMAEPFQYTSLQKSTGGGPGRVSKPQNIALP